MDRSCCSSCNTICLLALLDNVQVVVVVEGKVSRLLLINFCPAAPHFRLGHELFLRMESIVLQ